MTNPKGDVMTQENRIKLESLKAKIDSLQFINADVEWRKLWSTLGDACIEIDAVLQSESGGTPKERR
jgi:hypothetical protein